MVAVEVQADHRWGSELQSHLLQLDRVVHPPEHPPLDLQLRSIALEGGQKHRTSTDSRLLVVEVYLIDDGRHDAAHAPQRIAIIIISRSRSCYGGIIATSSCVAISQRMGLSFVCGYEGGLAPVIVHADDSILRCIVGILLQEGGEYMSMSMMYVVGG